MQIKDQESFFQVGVMLWCCMTKYIAINERCKRLEIFRTEGEKYATIQMRLAVHNLDWRKRILRDFTIRANKRLKLRERRDNEMKELNNNQEQGIVRLGLNRKDIEEVEKTTGWSFFQH